MVPAVGRPAPGPGTFPALRRTHDSAYIPLRAGTDLCRVSAATFAQETRGTIIGHVLDDQGGAMPGVTVTITNVDTNVSATLTTNSTGYYQAPLLLPGNYRVSAELQGFKTSVRSGVILSVAQQATVDLTLGVGAISETSP